MALSLCGAGVHRFQGGSCGCAGRCVGASRYGVESGCVHVSPRPAVAKDKAIVASDTDVGRRLDLGRCHRVSSGLWPFPRHLAVRGHCRRTFSCLGCVARSCWTVRVSWLGYWQFPGDVRASPTCRLDPDLDTRSQRLLGASVDHRILGVGARRCGAGGFDARLMAWLGGGIAYRGSIGFARRLGSCCFAGSSRGVRFRSDAPGHLVHRRRGPRCSSFAAGRGGAKSGPRRAPQAAQR